MIFGVCEVEREVEFWGGAVGATTVGPIMAGATVGVEVGEFVGAVVVTGDVEVVGAVLGALFGEGATIDGLDEVVGVGAEEKLGAGAEEKFGVGAITGDALVEEAGSDIWEDEVFVRSSGRCCCC
jgi:hypothetical protein